MRRALVAVALLAVAGCSSATDDTDGAAEAGVDVDAVPATAAPVADLTRAEVDTGVLTIVSRLAADRDDIEAQPSDGLVLDGCELVTDDALVVWGELPGEAAPQRVRVAVELIAGDAGWTRVLEGRLAGAGSLAVPLRLEGEEQDLGRMLTERGASCRLLLAGEQLGELSSAAIALSAGPGVGSDGAETSEDPDG